MTVLARAPLTLLSATLYMGGLWIIYLLTISPRFGYQGFGFEHVTTAKIGISIALSAVMAVFLPKVIRLPSELLTWLMFAMVVCPGTIVTASAYSGTLNQLLPFWFGLGACVVSLGLVGKASALPLRQVKIERSLRIGVFVLGAAALYGLVISTFGLRPPPALMDVYETRLEAREVLSGAAFGAGHALRALSNVVNPFLIVVGLLLRRPSFVLIGALGQFYIYTADGTKSTLLSILMLFGIYALSRTDGRSVSPRLLLWSLLLLCAGALIIDQLFFPESTLFTHVVIRRLVFVPGLMTNSFFEFFSDRPYFYWGGLLGIENQYPGYASPGFLVGNLVFNHSEANANANVLADGFANAGYLGMAASTMLLAGFLWIFDSVSKGAAARVGILLIAVPAFAATNTGVVTLVTTHGLGVAIVLMYWARQLIDSKVVEDQGVRSERTK